MMATEKHLEVVDIGSGHAGYGLVDLAIGLKPCNKIAVETFCSKAAGGGGVIGFWCGTGRARANC